MKTDKIVIEVNEECSGGSLDTTNNGNGVTAGQLMYAACVLIDTLLQEGAYTLDEILDIVKDIPKAEVDNTNSQLWN